MLVFKNQVHTWPLFLLSLLMVGQVFGDDPDLDFSRDVLPILSDKCFVCHGPDGAKESELRLDSAEGATVDLGGYQAVVPKAPEKSELIARIYDADNPMPPADEEKQLTDGEREILKQWIQQGGAYAKHWAYEPPKKQKGTIDQFIQKQLPDGVGLAPEAARHILARRVALVLTGLPPEPNELETFLNDTSANAYEKFVDRMLASPRYGEHQARYWLDAVRYGDTHGLHLDNRRGIHPYRDWVIRSFNRNQRFDEFLEWQLAGDLLPDPSLEQQVATGFVRMNPTTSEGGVIPAEFQAKNNFDRVETLGTALLGASFVCARCHTHKYDPITQTEYYQFMAFFNSTAESPLDGNAFAYGPVVNAPVDLQAWETWDQLQSDVAKFLDEVPVDTQSLNRIAASKAAWKTTQWEWTPSIELNESPDAHWKDIKGINAIKGQLPRLGQAQWIRVKIQSDKELRLLVQIGQGTKFASHLNDQLQSEHTSPAFLTIPAGESVLKLKVLGTDVAAPLKLMVQQPSDAIVAGGTWDDLPEESRLLLLADPGSELVDTARRARAFSLHQQMESAQRTFTTTLVARELPKPRETRLLERGEYDMPTGDPLSPAIPAIMGALPPDVPANRLGLARWLTAPENPLVSRVLVNRFWQQLFGVALVRTTEDFGLQGEYPTHPELLDWLAVEFQENGWNTKALLKTILMSQTFRQSSRWRSEVNDPENRWFARGPGFRLDAEVIRDIALWSGGILDNSMGGPGVKPTQPPGLWKALMHPASNTKQYVADTDGRQYRRSVYVYWKRTSPHPMMTLFDAPSRESSCVRRARSTTPLQSLGLLNEPQRMEAARALARRVLENENSDRARLDALFQLLASRGPSEAEAQVGLQLLGDMKKRYASSPEDAKAVSVESPDRDAAELAAWTQVAVTLLASDIAIRLN